MQGKIFTLEDLSIITTRKDAVQLSLVHQARLASHLYRWDEER